MDKGQIERFSKAEKELIKKVFKDSVVLYSLRNFFWQVELPEERKLLKFDEDTLRIIKKVMLPDIEREVPLGQQADETKDALLDQLAVMNPALAVIMIDANDLRVQYLTQRFNKIVSGKLDPEEGELVLKDLKKPMSVEQDDIRHINMLAYQSICRYIDGKIYAFEHYSNPPKEETEKEKNERLEKDSTK